MIAYAYPSRRRSLAFALAGFLMLSHAAPLQSHYTDDLLAKAICIGTGAYILSAGCCAFTTMLAQKKYASVRNIVHRPDLEPYHQHLLLRQEILRAHAQMVDSYWLRTPPYRNYPLLWYTKELDWYITLLRCSLLGSSHESDELLYDLCCIRHYLVTDYDVIKERRRYEERHGVHQ